VGVVRVKGEGMIALAVGTYMGGSWCAQGNPARTSPLALLAGGPVAAGWPGGGGPDTMPAKGQVDIALGTATTTVGVGSIECSSSDGVQ
jgi:hypothetical protein